MKLSLPVHYFAGRAHSARSVLAAVFAVGACSVLNAASIWESPGWSLHSSVNGQVNYDSNIFGQEGGDGDTYFSVEPTFWLQRRSSLTRLRVDAALTMRRYVEYSSEDSVDPRFSLSYGFPVNEGELPRHEAEIDVQRRTDVDPDVAERIRTTRAFGLWRGQIHDTGKTILDGEFAAGQFKNDRFNSDSRFWVAGVSVGFRPHDLLQYSAGYGYSVQEYNSGVDDLDDSERDEHELSVRLRGELTPKLKGRISFGVARGSTDGGVNAEGTDWTADVTLDWQVTERRQFNTRIRRTTNFTSDGNLVGVTTFDVGVTQEMAGGFSVNVRAGLRNVERESSALNDYSNYGFGAGVRYGFTARLVAELRGEVRTFDSSTARFDYSRYTLHFGATYLF